MNLNRTTILGLSLLSLAALGIAGCSGDDTSVTPATDGGLTDGAKGDSATPDAATTTDGSTTTDGGADAATTTSFVATLSGAEETPAVATTATGTATFELSADKTTLTYHLTHNVAAASAAHIHLGAGGEKGDVDYPLTPVSADMTGTITLKSGDADNLEAGKLYVNVHSPTHADGEIRGQLLHVGDKLFVADATGSEETPPPVPASAGSAVAAIILNGAKTSIRYHVTVKGITPTLAHIHTGLATQAGGVAIPLTPFGSTIDGTATVTPAQAADLADGHLYVNVHTAAFPNGEIRGQIMLPGEVLYSAPMTNASEVPPTTPAAATTGAAQFILDPAKTKLRYELAFTGFTATLSHIHTGVVGASGAPLYTLMLTGGGTGAKGTQNVTAADITALDAAGLYANAHSTAFPNGEVRGQITKH